jgi:methionine aminotransferase
MPEHTPSLHTKLPKVGTTIFTVMSALAAEKGAVNLGQGFPDFDCDPALLVQAVTDAMQRGHNQYPPMPGVPALREAVSPRFKPCMAGRLRAGTEITITAGATQAILTAILAVVRAGRRSHRAGALLRQLRAQHRAGRRRGRARAADAGHASAPTSTRSRGHLTPRTRAIIVNSPHNPSATVWTDADMRKLQELLAPTEVLLISDEVYEHMVYDGQAAPERGRYPAWRRGPSSCPALARPTT